MAGGVVTGLCPGCGEQRELNRRGRFRSHALSSGGQCPGSCREPEATSALPELGPCPHPEKARYATHDAARRICLGRPAIVGLVLTPYRCCCGWHHLTKNAQPSDATGSER